MLISAILFSFTVHAGVMDRVTAPHETSCQTEVDQYCKDAAREHAEMLRCLIKYEAQLADSCRQEVQALKQRHQGLSGLGGPMSAMGLATPGITYNGWTSPDSEPTALNQHRLSISNSVYKGAKDTLGLSTNASTIHLIDDYYRIDFGAYYSRKLEDNRMAGGRVSVGTASNEPFASSRGTTVSANAYYSYPSGENNMWMWTVFFSNNNSIANYIPIPGFIYFYRTKTFNGMFGIPVAAMQWTPNDIWTYSLSLFGPSVNAEVARGPRSGTQAFTGFNWGQQSFLREARADLKDRLYFEEKRALLGIRSSINDKLSFEVYAGRAFDRSTYEGKRFSNRNNKMEFDDAWLAGWNLRCTF